MTRITEDVEEAARVLHQGGVLAYATEAVFGLGCDPNNLQSLEKLLQLKQRPAHKGLILIAASETQLHPYLDLEAISPGVWQQVRKSWPGPVTWLLPVVHNVPALLRGEHETIAVRVTAHGQVQALCTAFGGAIVSTSANLSEQAPARNVSQVDAAFGQALDLILQGETSGADKPSEIRDSLTGSVIRAS